MNDLKFLTNRDLIQKVIASLRKTEETVISWGLSNIATYNIAKTEAILFS